jgi:predicted  nucleic acid-binding Zn-ribbon protein
MAHREIVINECECERCGHIWQTRNEVLPKVCPKCKSVRWNEQRVEVTVMRNGKVEKLVEVGEGIRPIEMPVDMDRLPGDEYNSLPTAVDIEVIEDFDFGS